MKGPFLSFQSAQASLSDPLDLGSFEDLKPIPEVEYIQGFFYGVGSKKPPLFEITKSKRVQISNAEPKRIKIAFKKGTATLYKKSVVLAGSVYYDDLEKLLKKQIPLLDFLKFGVTTSTWWYDVEHPLKLTLINQYHLKHKSPFFTITYTAGEDLGNEYSDFGTQRLVVRFKGGTATAMIYDTGKIIITSADEPSDALMDTIDDIVSKGPARIDPRAHVPKTGYALLKNKRNPLASNHGNLASNEYIRPGPNKLMRVYKIPTNPGLSRTKVQRSFENAGVPIPQNVRNIFGIAGLAKPKVSNQRANNWNAQRNGYYIRPGPQGQPKFYKIPRDISKGRKTVLEAYAKVSVKVPESVKKLFGIGEPVKRVEHPVIRNRLPKANLQIIAASRNLPVIGVHKKTLINMVRKNVPKVVGVPNFVLGGVNHFLIVESEKVKRDRERKLDSFKIQNLRNMFKAYTGSNVKASLKKNIVAELIKEKKSRNEINRQAAEAFANFSNSESEANESPAPQRTAQNIVRNALGPNASNADINRFLSEVSGRGASKFFNTYVNRYHRVPKTIPANVRNNMIYRLGKDNFERELGLYLRTQKVRTRLNKSPPKLVGARALVEEM